MHFDVVVEFLVGLGLGCLPKAPVWAGESAVGRALASRAQGPWFSLARQTLGGGPGGGRRSCGRGLGVCPVPLLSLLAGCRLAFHRGVSDLKLLTMDRTL